MSQPLDWVRDNKARAGALAFLAALGLLLAWMVWHARHLRLPPPATAAASAAQPAAPTASAVPDIPAGAGQRTARIRDQFERATDYLAFIQDAIDRPQEGGRFYALLAWQRCDGERDDRALTVEGAAPDPAPADLQKRCAGVKSQYPDLQTLYRVASERRGGRDALLPEDGRGFVTPATRETAQADVDAAIRSGDRYAIAHAMSAYREFLGSGEGGGAGVANDEPAPRCANPADCSRAEPRTTSQQPAVIFLPEEDDASAPSR